jgi:hypothetical protein
MGRQTYVWPFTFSTPANTNTTAPLITVVNLGDIWCDSVELDIPPGNKGLAGILLTNNLTYSKGASSFVPWSTPYTYILADNLLLKYPIGAELPGAFAIWTYNTDVLEHLVQVRILGYYMTQAPANSTVQPVAQLPVSA